MVIKKFMLRAAGVSLTAIALLTAQPVRAQSSSDTARIEKLERAVEMLRATKRPTESRGQQFEKTARACNGGH